MPSFKKVILFLHRWVGLITGLVVFIVCITGCLFVFQQEFTRWARHDMMYADTKAETTLPVSTLQQKAADALGVDHLDYGLKTYSNPDRNWSAYAYRAAPGHWTYFGNMKEYKTVYINPYTGNIAGVVNEKHDFFQIVKGLHWSLLLSTPIGQPIVVWSTVLFMLLLVSGLVLWWPKRWNKSTRRQSFKITSRSSWRRLNYDLHNVLGFYFVVISLILGFTGLAWYFPNFTQKTFNLLGNGNISLAKNPIEKTEKSNGTSQRTSLLAKKDKPATNAIQAAYRQAWTKFPQANSIIFITPTDSKEVIRAAVKPYNDTYYAKSHLQFNQYSGELIHSQLYQHASNGEKLTAMNYDIHVGAIAGIPGKIIAFLACLLCASLPVTGFIIWFDRERRSWEKV